MRQSELTIKDLYNLYFEVGKSTKQLSETLLDKYGIHIPERTIRYNLNKYYPGYHTEGHVRQTKPLASGEILPPDAKRERLRGNRFVITVAQNNTYVHEGFLTALMTYCAENKAQLLVTKCTYNINGFQNLTKDSDSDGIWYDPRLAEYFIDKSVSLAPTLILGAELDVLPTAANPISGFESYFGDRSGIIPHTKVAMKSLPRMKSEEPRFIYTTGALTQRNYIQRKAGQKAEFHHVYGALVVEVDKDDNWWVRQLIADDDGTFQDLHQLYTHTGDVETASVDGVVLGDLHTQGLQPNEMLDIVNYIKELKPGTVFVHDALDFQIRNHHNIKDAHERFLIFNKTTDSVFDEILSTASFLDDISEYVDKLVIVESNHDQALKRWLKDTSAVTDPVNMRTWFFYNLQLLDMIEDKGSTNVNLFGHILQEYFSNKSDVNKLHILDEDESYLLHGVEHGLHGHRGINGSRGSTAGYRGLGTKVTSAHTHSAAIIDGVYCAGVRGSLDKGYNRGPTTWSNSDVIMYSTGKRAIITLRGNKWKA